MEFAEESGLELVAEPAEIFGKPADNKYEKCDVLAQKMAEKILGN
jgi:hypothetical protein